MNEQKKARFDHFYSIPSESKQEELAATIASFIHKNNLKSDDWIVLTRLLKQLKNTNNKLPRKALSGIESRFIKISQNYKKR